MTDHEAVAVLAAGDQAAFSALVERHRRELHVHCYRMLGSLEEAEDRVQETFLRAWRRRARFEGRSNVRVWLYRIATNACLEILRRRPALNAVEAMRRQLAAELGRHGIRTVTLHTGGVAESLPEDFEGRKQILDMLVAPTMLKRTATFDDVANVAAFAASDHARTITAASINITCGAVAD